MRFYGGTPMTWLAETPMAVVRACVSQMSKLRARDSIRAATRVAMGSGSLKKQDAKQISREWNQAADWPKPPRTAAPKRSLSGTGIGLVHVPKKAIDGIR